MFPCHRHNSPILPNQYLITKLVKTFVAFLLQIGINPGLFAAYKGHHYAGPGNHFWKCLYLAGFVPEPMTAEDDFKLLHYGIGFTNMVARATKGSADLTRKEIREGNPHAQFFLINNFN